MSGMPTNYTQVFYDNFSGNSLNSGNWPVLYGGTGSNGAFTWDHGDVQVNNGLTINTKNTGSGSTSGGISQGWTGGTYGLYQVEAKVNPGQGTSPVIALWPDNNSWPPEIDLLEAPNGTGNAIMTLHWPGAGGSNQFQSIDTGVNVNGWHDYAVDWEPSSLTFYVDGKQVWHTDQNVPSQPMGLSMSGFVAANNDSWIGGGPNGSTPSTVPLQVAWASISKPNGSTPNASGSGGSSAPITSANTSGGGNQGFTTGGGGGGGLTAGPGNDVLKGGSGLDTFTVDATHTDGWAEIDGWHSGDVLSILGFQRGVSTINWTTATDPNGQSGATADISLKGNGHTDVAITFPGASQSDAQGWSSGNWQSASGTPELNIWKV
jgi:beta-glucanase (GH16 family)